MCSPPCQLRKMFSKNAADNATKAVWHNRESPLNVKQLRGASVVMSFLCARASAADISSPYVRIAELEIEPSQLEHFTIATKEVGEISVRIEPGCLVLYAVSEKDNPGRVTVFEIYRDTDAYSAHVQTPHFKKFRAAERIAWLSHEDLSTPFLISLAAKTKPG